MVSEGHSLHDLLDYEEGVDVESFFILYRRHLRNMAQRSKTFVDGMIVALGSLFDKKILREYNQSMDRALKQLERAGTDRERRKSTREDMVKSAKELRKLTAFLQGG